jgi:hypothetical protein
MDIGYGAAMGKKDVCGNSRSEAVPTRRNALKPVTHDATWESEDESLTGKAELRETRMPPTFLSFFYRGGGSKGSTEPVPERLQRLGQQSTDEGFFV